MGWLGAGYGGQGVVPRAYHPLVDLVSEVDLVRLKESVPGVIASCVAAMPTHEQFIERCCRASAAA